ncbi:DUF3304 domain-containing protein [Luteimonas sp. A501]
MILPIASAVSGSNLSIRWLVGLVLSLLALSACSREPGDYATAKISPYNHTEDYIHQLYVDEAYGGNSRAFGGGGSFVCCIVYPREWHEGLSAKVRWTTSSSVPGGSPEETWHEKVVPIERYERTGTRLNVHFLPGGEVRLLIWSGAAGTPGYAGPDAPAPPPGWPPKPPKPPLPEATVPDHAQPPPARPSHAIPEIPG